MEDRFLNISESVSRLIEDFYEYKNLYIAFDFDNTVFDYNNVGDTFPKLEKLLRYLKKHKEFTLILFTANSGSRLDWIVDYCEEHGYTPDHINENPVWSTVKPLYSILLDDRAGLNEAYQILLTTLKLLNYDYED